MSKQKPKKKSNSHDDPKYLDPDELKDHTMVVGSTGKGKTSTHQQTVSLKPILGKELASREHWTHEEREALKGPITKIEEKIRQQKDREEVIIKVIKETIKQKIDEKFVSLPPRRG